MENDNMKVGAEAGLGQMGYIKKDFGWDSVSLAEAVYQAVGAASVCWSDGTNGVFEDGKARRVAEQLLDRIKQEYVEIDRIGAELCTTEADAKEQPQEWIERQEEERRAWAIGEANDHLKQQPTPGTTGSALLKLAGEIEAFVKGPQEDLDLHDQDAFDTWGVVMTEQLAEMLYREPPSGMTDQQRDYVEARLNDFSDSLTKSGVRLKNGEKFERLDED